MRQFFLGLLVGAAGGAAAASAAARRRDRRREALFSFAAHEIASPLTGIQLTVRNFLGGAFGEVNEGQRKWLEILQDQVLWLGGVASDLGDLSHLEMGGRIKLLPSEFRPGPVVEKVLSGWGRQAQRWGVAFETSVEPDLPAVRGDEARVERLLRALVGHAVKFSVQPGSVSVRASSRPGEVRFEVAFTPLDRSGGEPSELFGRYYAAAQGKTLRMSGVGFALARDVVERLGGRLGAERGSDGRDRFTLALPAAKKEEVLS